MYTSYVQVSVGEPRDGPWCPIEGGGGAQVIAHGCSAFSCYYTSLRSAVYAGPAQGILCTCTRLQIHTFIF